MIIKISKATPDTLDQVSGFVFQDQDYMIENFPQCGSKEEVTERLRKASDNWYVLVVDQPVALFSLQLTGPEASLERFCIQQTSTLRTLIPTLQSDLRSMKVASTVVIVRERDQQAFAEVGYRKKNTLIAFANTVSETQSMLILPMSNPTEKDIPILAKLMFESYANGIQKFQDAKSAEARLRSIVKGANGTFLSDASFTCGMQGNLVSACFLASDLPKVARVVQLFTHPLYRARGLATIELAIGMNRLRKSGVLTLTSTISECNEVAVRLFTKLGFNKLSLMVEMSGPLS